MQDNLKNKWNVTNGELKQAIDELCAKGIAKGCFQSTYALCAILDLLDKGDIAKEEDE